MNPLIFFLSLLCVAYVRHLVTHHILFSFLFISIFVFFYFPVVDPTLDDSLVSVILVSLLPLLAMGLVVVGMFYWYRVYRKRMNQEWESSMKKRKPKAGGLDCSDACAIMMDDDRSDSSSTHANNLNHNTEPLPIELDQLVQTSSISVVL